MKIKKKSTGKIKNKKASPGTLPAENSDRRNIIIVICIILLVNILLYFTAFPMFDNIAAADLKPNAASRASFFKIIVIVVTDIFLFITVSMFLSRRAIRNKKQ